MSNRVCLDWIHPRYFVDDSGKVFSRKKNELIRLKTHNNKAGYERVCLSVANKKKNYSIHRLVLEAFAGKSKLQVNHKNGIKLDNNLSNLEYVTCSQNISHAHKTGLRFQGGDKNPGSRSCDIKYLTVMTMKLAHGKRYTNKEAALYASVSSSSISTVFSGRTWKHLPTLRKLTLKSMQ